MKKLDKLILSSFIGPFIITFLVVVFILLTQHMLKYFDDIIGKGLGMDVIGRLLFYFAIFMTPVAMPLAVLLSSLIAYGNLGEHFELTAVKSAGISLNRTLLPIFFFVVMLTVVAFFVNNNLVPKAALEAYSLLYDIKQKKPALDLREGAFYSGIPDMSIKVNKKFPDGITIKDVLIYDHRKHDGNRDVTIADSGRMYTIMQERYLKLELFKGYNYTEGASSQQDLSGKKRSTSGETFSRSQFAKTQVVFDLSSFQLETTDPKLFQGNRMMRNISELQSDMDSVDREILETRLKHYEYRRNLFTYFSTTDTMALPQDLREYKAIRKAQPSILSPDPVTVAPVPVAQVPDSSSKPKALVKRDSATSTTKSTTPSNVQSAPPVTKERAARRDQETRPGKKLNRKIESAEVLAERAQKARKIPLTAAQLGSKIDSIFALDGKPEMFENAANKARGAKSQITATAGEVKGELEDRRVFQIQWHKILASSLACIAMFLIGAPLGAIIKKGGLGVPFLVSILFFIIYYLLTMQGEKLAKKDAIPVPVGVWAADVILFFIGLYFLRQARLDARFFEADYYLIQIEKAKKWLSGKGLIPGRAA
ncbi:MAG: LptF/LptG family permease [Cyclobacteriaceae bacterium]|nr:LptF/LptG family permease [Cyclobacteriaceae bacterium]